MLAVMSGCCCALLALFASDAAVVDVAAFVGVASDVIVVVVVAVSALPDASVVVGVIDLSTHTHHITLVSTRHALRECGGVVEHEQLRALRGRRSRCAVGAAGVVLHCQSHGKSPACTCESHNANADPPPMHTHTHARARTSAVSLRVAVGTRAPPATDTSTAPVMRVLSHLRGVR
jgi:hypothetical protein